MTFLNPINLNGGARTVQVTDNPNATGDYAVLSGAISDSIGGGSLLKTGTGILYVQGSTSNTYSGLTTIQGTLVAAKTGGAVAIPGNVTLSETSDGVTPVLQLNGDGEISSSAVLTFNAPTTGGRLELNGHAQTFSSIVGNANSVIEGLWDNTGLNTNSTLTLNNASDCTFAGVIRDSFQGSGTGKVSLTKNGLGSLVLSGIDTYTGTTTVTAGTLQVTGSIQASSAGSVSSGATLYFNRAAGCLGCNGTISGAGTVEIYQGSNAVNLGGSGCMSLNGLTGPVNIDSGAVSLATANALGSGAVNLGNGANCNLAFSTAASIANSFTLNGIGGTSTGVAMPAIYGGGSGGTYTLSGQITLAATSDVGNSTNNGPLTLSGKITGSGGLVVENSVASLTDQGGSVTIAGTDNNNYAGTTTINRGTVILQKSGGAVAIPGNVAITADTTNKWNTYLILGGSNQIASSAVMSFPNAGHAYFELMGNNQTLAGISNGTAMAVIENTDQQTGISNLATLTINNTTDCSYNGYIRNGDLAPNGASTGLLALVKSGPGTLKLSGRYTATYTGGLTVNAGTVDYSNSAALPGTPVAYPTGPTGPTSPAVMTPCPYTINGGTLATGTLSASIGAFQISGGTVTGTGTLTSNAAYDVRGGTVRIGLAGASIGLNKSTSTLAVLSGTNSYTG